ncbi:hypothetical protein Btru_038780 [Bulinus truncatus]|nr:hypothetical protein Btru_038780 [Bulinus truncatus]
MLRLLYLVFSLLGLCWKDCDVNGSSTQADAYQGVINELLSRSESSRRRSPAIGSSVDRPFRLTYTFSLIDVIELDQINQLMTVLAYVQINWTDAELWWNATEYGNTTDVLLDASSIWTPKILVLTGAKDSQFLEFNQELLVSSNGEVMAAISRYITFRCEIHFMNYPFDSQSCSFGLTYFTVRLNWPVEIHMRNISIQYKDYAKAGEWKMIGNDEVLYKDANGYEFPMYTFIVKRQSVYYVITAVFPMVLTSVMIPLVFLIPTKTGEKISYLVTMFTSTAIFLSYISNVMPRNLSVLPYLAALLIEVMCEGLAAVLATLWVINMSESADHSDRQLFTKSKVLPQHMGEEVDSKNEEKSHLNDVIIQERRDDVKMHHRRYIRRVDRSLFVIFASFQLVYLSVLFGATGWIQ